MGGSNSATSKAALGRSGAAAAGKAIISKAFTKSGTVKAGASKKAVSAAKLALQTFRLGRSTKTAKKKAKKAATIGKQLLGNRVSNVALNAARQAANRRNRSGD